MRTRTGRFSRARASGVDAVRGALFGANDNIRDAVRARGARGSLSGS